LRSWILSFCEINFPLRYLIDGIFWAFFDTEKTFIAAILVDSGFIFYDGYGLDWADRKAKATALTFFNINP
jgi:hypothetical protein